MIAAAAMAVAPAAQAAAPLSVAHSPARAGATMSDSNDLHRGTSVLIGLIILILLIAIVTGNNRNEPSNSP